MKVCIKNKEFNPSYISIHGEEMARKNKYTIFNIPQGYEDCAFEDFDQNGFNIDLYNVRKLKEQSQHKSLEYHQWFENYFDKQLNQSLWQNDFIPSHDTYFNKNYTDIEELKEQAEFVRQEIKRLK